MTMVGEVAKMRKLTDGIAAGASIVLEPSGTHFMLTHLTQPLVEGERRLSASN